MGLYHIRAALPSDNPALLALCEVPIPGTISLTFERRPDYFSAAALQCDETEIYVCLDASDKAVGMFGVGKRRVWYGNEQGWVRYFSDLRIGSGANGTRLFLEMCHFVKSKGISGDFPAQTVVFQDNKPMVELIKSGKERSARLGLPYYHEQGCYVSYLLSLSHKPSQKPHPWKIRRAMDSDLERLQDFYTREAPKQAFAPVFDFKALGSATYPGLSLGDFYLLFEEQELHAVLGIWDQKSIKQTRVVAYAPWLSRLRPLLNLLSPLTGEIKLPPAGQMLNYLNVFAPMVRNNDSEAYHALLSYVLREKHGSGAAYLLAGLMKGHPLESALQRFRHKRVVLANFYWVNLSPILEDSYKKEPIYFEIARI